MDFQTMYQLYDYYCRMFIHYDTRWLNANSLNFHLANEFLILKEYFERALRDL